MPLHTSMGVIPFHTLQELAVLLARLQAGGHKCLIFTQMSKMLDVLEVGTHGKDSPNLHPVPFADGLRCMHYWS